jgi:hypothetical protein
MDDIDPEDSDTVAGLFGIAPAMAREIVSENDEAVSFYRNGETPEARYTRMREWVLSQIKDDKENVDP